MNIHVVRATDGASLLDGLENRVVRKVFVVVECDHSYAERGGGEGVGG